MYFPIENKSTRKEPFFEKNIIIRLDEQYLPIDEIKEIFNIFCHCTCFRFSM